jgi:hypothetical protein
MDIPVKKTRLEFLFDVFKKDYDKAIKAKVLAIESKPKNKSEALDYFDPYFTSFYTNFFGLNNNEINGETSMDKVFNYFVNCDPSPNKEYVSWFLNLYRNNIKIRTLSVERKIPTDPTVAVFFEDLQTKVTESLEVFSFLKLTNVLSVEARDINRYKSIHQFVNMVKPYMSKDDGDDSIHTLDHKELKCIQNFTKGSKDDGKAELVFENDNWIIVITHDKEANVEFGKYTTWCTAGTRYGSMFDSYHGRGELFVLIEKGYGSKSAVKKNPQHRLQFHFEDNMYMDALDHGININEFFFENKDIKKYFRSYIVKNVLPKRQQKNRQVDDIKYLLNLGFGDEIIKILKDSKPTTVDFSGHKIETEYLENLGEITSIEKLDLSDCGINKLPESISKLKNLKSIRFRNNKNITEIPTWFNKLTNLEYLDCAGCDVKKIGDLSTNTKLSDLVLDYNPNLTKLPDNIGKLSNLHRLTASTCDLREISDDITNCSKLYLIDVHMNTNLEKIPIGLSKLPDIVAICIDDTKVSMQTKKMMESDSNGNVCIIKYGQ